MENIKKNINDIPTDNGAILFVKEVKAPSALLRDLVFPLKAEVPNVVLIIGVKDGDKATLCVALGDEIVARGVNAGEVVRAAAKEIQGGGGGQAFFATAGGKNAAGLDSAIAKAVEIINEKLK
jgi:alanyl-tRNA synthetase